MLELIDLDTNNGSLAEDALDGLRARPRTLPCKYFYNDRGAQLFEQICELPEYYPTRTELGILREHLPAMAASIGSRARIVEYGSGAGTKIRLLLDALEQPVAYTPVDIARSQLRDAARQLQKDYPAIEVLPVCADYSEALQLPKPTRDFDRTVVFFPGSTIGNFEPETARAMLTRFARLAAQGEQPGGLLIGVDVKKQRTVLEAAYNDARGLTADFNLNILRRLNEEIGANFALDHWRHQAIWNESTGAIEMHLISGKAQEVRLNGDSFHFNAGESVHTENSFKYYPEEFIALAEDAGFVSRGLWQDPERLFSVHHFALA